jgi:hypothetical protein
MGLRDMFKFSRGYSNTATSNIQSARSVQYELVKDVVEKSDFYNMPTFESYENIYYQDAEVGGSIDRMSTLAGQCFKGFKLKNKERAGKLGDSMIADAQFIADNIKFERIVESCTEQLMINGNYIVEIIDESFRPLPMRYMTIVEENGDVGDTGSDKVLMITGLYVYKEDGEEGERKVLKPEDVVHIKYKDTPIFFTDNLGRETYGLYSISPLARAIHPVWWKRQTMIIDILWRWMNVPREHHKIDSTMFELGRYSGSPSEKNASANRDAQTFTTAYIETMKHQAPDQKYVTLDNVDIDMVESSNSYMRTNDLMNQLNNEIYTALNVSSSIVNGTNTGSYASELIISNYVSAKAIELAEKASAVPMRIVKDRLLSINSNYPVDELDAVFELVMATSKLEMFRIAAIMATLNSFTQNEIRESVGYTDFETGDDIVTNKVTQTDEQIVSNTMKGDSFPETPQSDVQHTRDAGQNANRESESL